MVTINNETVNDSDFLYLYNGNFNGSISLLSFYDFKVYHFNTSDIVRILRSGVSILGIKYIRVEGSNSYRIYYDITDIDKVLSKDDRTKDIIILTRNVYIINSMKAVLKDIFILFSGRKLFVWVRGYLYEFEGYRINWIDCDMTTYTTRFEMVIDKSKYVIRDGFCEIYYDGSFTTTSIRTVYGKPMSISLAKTYILFNT